MTRRVLQAAAAVLALASCDKELTPLGVPGAEPDFVRAADILVAAQCELDAAASRSPAAFPFRKVDLTMTLTLQRSESVGGGITLAVPIASAEVTLRRDRTPVGASLRKMDFRITHEIGTAGPCPTAEQPVTASGVRFIDGGLGLTEWVAEADALVAKSGQIPTELSHLMIFEVVLTRSLAPIFSRPLDSVDGTLSSRDAEAREVRHKIVATIVPDTGGSAAANDVRRADAAERFQARVGE